MVLHNVIQGYFVIACVYQYIFNIIIKLFDSICLWVCQKFNISLLYQVEQTFILIFKMTTRCFHGVVSLLIFHGICSFTASFFDPVKLSRAIWNFTEFSRDMKNHGFHIVLSISPVKIFHGVISLEYHGSLIFHGIITAFSRVPIPVVIID